MDPQHKHYDFFVSSKWRNKEAVLDLVKNIRAKGYSVYCFLEEPHAAKNSIGDAEKFMEKFEQLDWRQDPYVRRAFTADMEGERNSETYILLLPAGKSCHIEAGAAYGMGKKCVLIGEQTEAETSYLIFDEIYATVDDFLNKGLR